jgi:rare lipoprotein A
MQTKLRMVNLLVLSFVAGLLWTSPLAAQKPKGRQTAVSAKPHYVGVASWYGAHHQGRKMANGQRFDRNKLTAAYWSLPLGTVLRVVNLKNGNSVMVTVTDRGPNTRLHRVLDLSEAAALQLDYIHDGLTRVFISPVAPGQFENAKIDSTLIEPPSEDAAPQSNEEGTSLASLQAQQGPNPRL